MCRIHTAGNGAATHTVGVGSIGVYDIRIFRCDPSDTEMLCQCNITQLQHIAQHRNPAALPLSKHLQRRSHGLRPGIIAVTDNGIAIYLTNLLTAGHVPDHGRPSGDL